MDKYLNYEGIIATGGLHAQRSAIWCCHDEWTDVSEMQPLDATEYLPCGSSVWGQNAIARDGLA